jgi:hypothetical protein
MLPVAGQVGMLLAETELVLSRLVFNGIPYRLA